MTSPFSILNHSKRIVAVTGIGAVTPLGLTFVDSWEALLRGTSGATTLEQALVQHQGLPDWLRDKELQMAKDLPCQVVAPVKGFPGTTTTTDFGRRSTARFIDLAVTAAHEAIQHAGLADYLQNATDEQRARIGVSIGSGMSAVRDIAQSYDLMTFHNNSNNDNDNNSTTASSSPSSHRRPYRRLSPHFVPKVLPNSAAGRVSMLYGGMWGPNLAPSTACAAGAHALGHAYAAIVMGQADLMLAGGTEAAIDPLSLAGFCQLRALANTTNTDHVATASRPFDQDRNGFVLAEGAAILVLEEWSHARARSRVPPLALLTGYGASGDGFHVTAPDPAGRGAIRAMQGALVDSQTRPSHVQYVNAHATSTPKGDEIEARAIAQFLGQERAQQMPLYVSSTKGHTGHLLGAAGALEAAFTVQSLVHQIIPPTLNLETLDPNAGHDSLHFVRDEPMRINTTTMEGSPLRVALSNSFGFGGTNASLLFELSPETDA